MAINFTNQITIEFFADSGMKFNVYITGNKNTIYAYVNDGVNIQKFGIIHYDNVKHAFSGRTSFATPISNVYSGAPVASVGQIDNQALIESKLRQYTVWQEDGDLSTMTQFGQNAVYSLNNEKINEIIGGFDLYYTGPPDGGFNTADNVITCYGPNPYGYESPNITFDYKTLTFSGKCVLELTYPLITQFRQFTYDPDFKYKRLKLMFIASGDSIIPYSGPMSGKITVVNV